MAESEKAVVSRSSTVPASVREVASTEPTLAPGTSGGAGGCGLASTSSSASMSMRVGPGSTSVTCEPEAGALPLASAAHLKAK